MGDPQLSPSGVPSATYRVQFNRDFTFAHATEIVPYLCDLGVSHLYASPIFQSGPQSTHGYDICGFQKLNPNLGTEEDFHRLVRSLKQHGLGLLLDMVPNHMGTDLSNAWWVDVLEKGPSSAYAKWFDIDWEPPNSDLRNRVLLPILEDRFGNVLESGKLRLEFLLNGSFAVTYYDRQFPLAAASCPELIADILDRCPEGPASMALADKLRADCLEYLEGLKAALSKAASESAEVRQALDQTLAEWNGSPGDPSSFGRLYKLLKQQHYRLAYWRVGLEEINYRRFFDVAQLVSMRVEEQEAFEGIHKFLFELINGGDVTALRIDHPDGLWNPQEYCRSIQARVREPIYVVVEKILTEDEHLPDDWPVHGTTGYDFLNLMNGVFVEVENAPKFDALYASFVGAEQDFGTIHYQSKRKVLLTLFQSELNALTHRLKRLANRRHDGVDFTFTELRSALIALISAFPVYRTYITDEGKLRSPDIERIHDAYQAALRRAEESNSGALEFLRRVLLLEASEESGQTPRSLFADFVGKFQQLTGPIIAKGLEDTAFYNYNRLVSLNEVGGSPERFGITTEEFHSGNLSRADRWPHSMVSSATHDTKRGEDVRARLNVLSEMPRRWSESIQRWNGLNASLKTLVARTPAPDKNDEYLFYQTLVGVWTDAARTSAGLQILRNRLVEYMSKAIKESKRHTSWLSPDELYEAATKRFVEGTLSDPENEFLREVQSFQEATSHFGAINSLAQVLLKICAPGVPDFYQGTELPDLTLVDPDNRRPVDYELRRACLSRLTSESTGGAPGSLLSVAQRTSSSLSTGEAKLFLVWRVLNFRKQNPELFRQGDYHPIPAFGTLRRHVCAFVRNHADKSVVAIVPRLVNSFAGPELRLPIGEDLWRNTQLDLSPAIGQRFRSVLTGELIAIELEYRRISVGSLLKHFPVGLFVTERLESL